MLSPARHPLTSLALALLPAAQIAATACGDDPTTPRRPGPPRRPTIVVVSGDGQRAEVGTSLAAPLVVRVADSLGAPAPMVVVHFTSTTPYAEDSSTTDALGVASARWTLGGRAGTQEIIARASVYPANSNGTASVTFRALAVAGAPARIAFAGGDGAVAAPNTQVDPLVVVAADRFDNALPAVAVTWVVTAGGGSIRPIDNRTDADGAARAIWVLGPNEGTNTAEVTVGSITGEARATASVTLTGTSVVAGDAHSCALTSSGAVYCWGANSSGQLGVRTIDDDVHSVPQRVGGGLVFASLVAGAAHTCGLTREGTAYCWGNGRSGQIGNGFAQLVFAPTPIAGGLKFGALAAGASHTCGLTSAGTILCWGDNTVGQLADGSVRLFGTPGGNTLLPTPIVATDGGIFVAIAAGSFSTCAISVNGATFCWGANAEHELGGQLPGRCYVIANQFRYDGTPLPCSTEPARLGISQRLGSLAANGSGWCGAATSGELLCWGNAFDRPQIVTGARVSKAWVVGKDVCGPETTGLVSCWGVWGRTGFPVVRPFGDRALLGDLAAGGRHSCGVSRDGRSVVYCWGSNSSGQVGDGSTDTRALPVAVLSSRVN